MSDKPWSLYLLRNERGALYTGITTDVHRRLREHRGELKGAARFTRACKKLELVYHCTLGSRSLALKAEARLKRLPKSAKEKLVSMQPTAAELLKHLRVCPVETLQN
ncbi:MAG: hypothetical protein C0624_09100 [Desulfuromonas sp.]|nr:MAG: hypothetical protein C0624_09100 [Desulfuromonas sp.]